MALRSCLGWDVDTFLTQIVMPFEWGAGFGNDLQIEDEVVAALSSDGYASYGTPDLLYEHLFAFVFRLLCQQGKKEPTRQRLEEELARPSIGPARFRKLQYALAIARELHFRRAADKLHVSQFSGGTIAAEPQASRLCK
jgi:hypothetical protein